MIYIIIDYDRWTNGIKIQAGQSLKISRDLARVQNKQCKPHTIACLNIAIFDWTPYTIYNKLTDTLVSTWQYCIYCYLINGETLCDESSTAQIINSLRKDKIMLYLSRMFKYSFLLVLLNKWTIASKKLFWPKWMPWVCWCDHFTHLNKNEIELLFFELLFFLTQTSLLWCEYWTFEFKIESSSCCKNWLILSQLFCINNFETAT